MEVYTLLELSSYYDTRDDVTSRVISLCVYICVCLSVCLCVCLAGALRSPAAPTVLVLSDTAVMVRWTAVPTPSLGGLSVMFYKVQYRRVGSRRKSHGWETVDEDIPSSKLAVRVNRLRPGLWLSC